MMSRVCIKRSRSLQGHHLNNFDGLESPMLQAMFRKNLPAGSGEEGFRRVFTIYGRGGYLGHVTSIM